MGTGSSEWLALSSTTPGTRKSSTSLYGTSWVDCKVNTSCSRANRSGLGSHRTLGPTCVSILGSVDGVEVQSLLWLPCLAMPD
jgi:hypothetical protein